jgi:large subunit ribosomal protein L3
MVEGLIGKKIGMSQIFDADGNVVPVTVIRAGPCTVIQKKTKEKDGYAAVQLGLVEDEGVKQPIKPQLGHFKKAGVPPVRILREFRFEEEAEVKEGDQVLVDIFEEGERVHVVGTSKGKGFASVIKRWGFRGGKASHGSMFHRSPGSIGASAFPSRVVKGKKLPGHMGHNRVTIMNITIVQADKENNLLVVKGAVPGANGGYLLVKKADFNIHGGGEKKPALEVKKQIPEEKKKALEEKKVPEAKQQVPAEKKFEEGKPEEKKPEKEKQASEEMKPKPEEKKPEEKKLEEKKPAKKKSEQKRKE